MVKAISYDKLTDEAIDELLAERAMGWRLCQGYHGSQPLQSWYWRDVQNNRRGPKGACHGGFSKDMHGAWQVVKRMGEFYPDERWERFVFELGEDAIRARGAAGISQILLVIEPRVICIAALRTIDALGS